MPDRPELNALTLTEQATEETALQVSKMCKLRGWAEPPALGMFQFWMDVIFRVLLHAVITVIVVLHPNAWSSPVFYLMAVNGMAYMNWLNYSTIVNKPQYQAKFLGRTGNSSITGKVHAA